MRILIPLLSVFFALQLKAQVSIDRTKHDFGTLSGDAVRYTDFIVRNEGNDDAFILSVKPSSRMLVFSMEHQTIEVGKSTRIRFLINPNVEGKFSESAEIFVSTAAKPISVKLIGSIKGLYDLQRMSCPDFSSTRDARSSLQNGVVIEVRDVNTKLPIQGAKLSIVKSATEAFELKTNKAGKTDQVIPLGLYGVKCEAKEYDTKILEAYFNRTNNYLLVELGTVVEESEEDLPSISMVRPEANNRLTEETPRFIPEPPARRPETSPELKPKPVFKEIEKEVQYAPVEKDIVIEEELIPAEAYGSKEIEYDPFADDEVEQQKTPVKEVEQVESKPVVKTPTYIESEVEKPVFKDNPTFSSKEYKPNNIVFLIDRSVSMRNDDKLELLKKSMENLLSLLRPIDKLAVVVYATEAEVLIPSQAVNDPTTFINAINNLSAGGMTNGAKGLREAYAEASNNFLEEGNNQVFLATDGAFSEGSDKIKSMAKRYGRRGISLSMIGVKNKDWTEKFLEEIASEGNGAYIHLTDEEDAKHKLIDEIKSNSKVAGATGGY